MEKLCLTGFSDKFKSEKLQLFLPSVKQQVHLPKSEPERSIEERRRSLINDDKASISKLTIQAVNQGRTSRYHVGTIGCGSVDDPGALNSILGKHSFPLCQGPLVIPLDNDAACKIVGEGYPHPSGSGKWICPPIEKLSAKEVFATRTMFTHVDSQKCHEWFPTLTGNNAWDPENLKDPIQLQELQDPDSIVQGPASTKTMGIVYTCNNMKCIVHCPCFLCNEEKKTCKLLCRTEVCCDCNSQCLNHQIKLPRLFNSETDLFTLVTNELGCYRFGIPYAGIPGSCIQCARDVEEHQKLHLVFHTRCRYCRSDLRPFEQRKNIVTVEDYCEAEKLLKWVDQKTCSYCLIQCKDKFKREEHEATVHENNGKFKCEICGKTYSNKNALNYHISYKHNSDKEEICCKLCPSNFTTDANLQRHIATVHKDHSQIFMFHCEKCDKQFSRKDNLNAHAREKHFDVNANLDFVEDLENLLQNKCDQCNKVFKRKNMLQRHVRTVHCESEERKQFQCSKCDSKFSRPDNLKRHVTLKHVDSE